MNPILVVALTAAFSAPSAAPRPEPPARAALGGFVYFICRATDDTGGEANCAGPALLWAGIAGAGGAAVGAGVDALVDHIVRHIVRPPRAQLAPLVQRARAFLALAAPAATSQAR